MSLLENLEPTKLATTLLQESIDTVKAVQRGDTLIGEKIKQQIQEALPLIQDSDSPDNVIPQEKQPNIDPELIDKILNPRTYELTDEYFHLLESHLTRVTHGSNRTEGRTIPWGKQLLFEIFDLDSLLPKFKSLDDFFLTFKTNPNQGIDMLKVMIKKGDGINVKTALIRVIDDLDNRNKPQLHSVFIELIQSEVEELVRDPNNFQKNLECITCTTWAWEFVMGSDFDESLFRQTILQLAEKHQEPLILFLGHPPSYTIDNYKFDYNFFDRNLDLFIEALTINVTHPGRFSYKNFQIIQQIPKLPTNHRFLKLIDQITDKRGFLTEEKFFSENDESKNDEQVILSLKLLKSLSTPDPKLENLKFVKEDPIRFLSLYNFDFSDYKAVEEISLGLMYFFESIKEFIDENHDADYIENLYGVETELGPLDLFMITINMLFVDFKSNGSIYRSKHPIIKHFLHLTILSSLGRPELDAFSRNNPEFNLEEWYLYRIWRFDKMSYFWEDLSILETSRRND